MKIPDFIKLTSKIMVEKYQMQISQENLKKIMNSMVEAFRQCMETEGDLLITGLGHFYICEGRQRKYYNTRTGEYGMSFARNRIGVAWANKIKDLINKE